MQIWYKYLIYYYISGITVKHVNLSALTWLLLNVPQFSSKSRMEGNGLARAQFYSMKQQQQLPYTPQYGEHGNVIRNQHSKLTSGGMVTRVIECSDIVFSEFEGYTQKLKSIPITEVKVLRKDLDKPLGLLKSFFAKVVSIKEEHQFLILHTPTFVVSVDYYIKNRLVIRIGDQGFVLDYQKSETRKNAKILREGNGLEWRRIIRPDEELTLGIVLDMLMEYQIKEFSQISYTGSHFSQEVFNAIQYKLIRPK